MWSDSIITEGRELRGHRSKQEAALEHKHCRQWCLLRQSHGQWQATTFTLDNEPVL